MQLERKRKRLELRGIRVAAVTFDSVETLAHFAKRANIGYPLLADTDSTLIRAFGILNQTVPEDHAFYGMAVPGEYLISPDRRVRSKHFEEDYRDRGTAGRTLVRTLDAGPDGHVQRVETPRYTVSAWASDNVVRGGNRFSLVVDVKLPAKMHVYAPQVEGYIPIHWSMEDQGGVEILPVEYPDPETLHLPAIGETVPVYQDAVRLVRDVQLSQPDGLAESLSKESELTLTGSLRLQACDDKVCFVPETVELEWKIKFEQHDRQRVPESLRAR